MMLNCCRSRSRKSARVKTAPSGKADEFNPPARARTDLSVSPLRIGYVPGKRTCPLMTTDSWSRQSGTSLITTKSKG